MNSILFEYGFDDAVFNFLRDNVKGYDVGKIFVTYINKMKETNGSDYPCGEVAFYVASLKHSINVLKDFKPGFKPDIYCLIRDMASCIKSTFDDKDITFTKSYETVYVMTISGDGIHVLSNCSVRSIDGDFNGFGMFGSNGTIGIFDPFGQFITAFNHPNFIFESKDVLDKVREFILAVFESKLEE